MPVYRVKREPERVLDQPCQGWRRIAAGGSHLDSGDGAVEPRHVARRIEIHEHVLVVVFVHARFEYAGDFHGEDAWNVRAAYRIGLGTGRRDELHFRPRKRLHPLGDQLPDDDTAPLTVGGRETEVAHGRLVTNRRHHRSRRAGRDDACDLDTLGVCDAGCHQGLRQDDRCSGYHTSLFPDLVEHGRPVANPQLRPVVQHADVRTADEDLLPEVVLQAVHDADDDDQRADAHDHATHRDDGDKRQKPRAAPAAQVSPGDRKLESPQPTPHGNSGRMSGKRIASRMCAVPVRYMKRRSTPIPTPPIGGIPYSMARR